MTITPILIKDRAERSSHFALTTKFHSQRLHLLSHVLSVTSETTKIIDPTVVVLAETDRTDNRGFPSLPILERSCTIKSTVKLHQSA
jgi:hypothetical protein